MMSHVLPKLSSHKIQSKCVLSHVLTAVFAEKPENPKTDRLITEFDISPPSLVSVSQMLFKYYISARVWWVKIVDNNRSVSSRVTKH